MSICLQCGKKHSNVKFCNRSCQAIYRNKHHHQKQGKCKHCNTIISSQYTYCTGCCTSFGFKPHATQPMRYKNLSNRTATGKSLSGKLCASCAIPLTVYNKRDNCRKCNTENYRNKLNNTTKGELFSKHHDQMARVLIRKHCFKNFTNSGKPFICAQCGYSHHAEVCHIKSISSFPETATLSEINHLDNLITLCPNCHWEYDNGILLL